MTEGRGVRHKTRGAGRRKKKSRPFRDGVQLPHTVRRFVANGPGAGASTAREKNRSASSIETRIFMILLRDPLS